MPNQRDVSDLFLDGCDEVFEDLFVRRAGYVLAYTQGGSEAGGQSDADLEQMTWTRWQSFQTEGGFTIYIHPLWPKPRWRLVDGLRDLNWSAYCHLNDGRFVFSLHQPAGLAVVYVVGRIPWRSYNFNLAGLLHLGCLLMLSAAVLAILVGLLLSYFS